MNVTLTKDLTGRNEEQEQATLEAAVLEVIGDREVARQIADIIYNYKTKNGINNALMREFPSQDNKVASGYYKAIKNLIKDKR